MDAGAGRVRKHPRKKRGVITLIIDAETDSSATIRLVTHDAFALRTPSIIWTPFTAIHAHQVWYWGVAGSGIVASASTARAATARG